MSIVAMKKGKGLVVLEDLDFRNRNVAFEAKVFNMYGNFD
jgi:hypothetical protein